MKLLWVLAGVLVLAACQEQGRESMPKVEESGKPDAGNVQVSEQPPSIFFLKSGGFAGIYEGVRLTTDENDREEGKVEVYVMPAAKVREAIAMVQMKGGFSNLSAPHAGGANDSFEYQILAVDGRKRERADIFDVSAFPGEPEKMEKIWKELKAYGERNGRRVENTAR
jgi:hypothetical protein